ncbi:MAG: amidohydrolase family protein, partial [Microbacterium sp.]
RFQLDELLLRAQVQSNAAVLRDATVTAARLLGVEDRIGQLKEGFVADLLVVDGDPLADLACLTRPEEHLLLGVHDGVVFHEREGSAPVETGQP